MTARSSTYVVELIVMGDVLNVYPSWFWSNHLCSGSRKIRNKYGLRVLPYMVPLWMAIGFVFPKYGPVNVVYDSEYMQPISAMASFGKPRSNMIARSWA
jgi:hypothetical protein